MMRLLRHNSRHHLRWQLSGEGRTRLPRLNPISSQEEQRLFREARRVTHERMMARWEQARSAA